MQLAAPSLKGLGVVEIADSECKLWKCVPIAIPSKRREQALCEQTLHVRRSYEYDMSILHVFVDATQVRPDGSKEYDVYSKHLREHGWVTEPSLCSRMTDVKLVGSS